MKPRKASVERVTRETNISVSIDLDGDGQASIKTGVGFLDHMLTALTVHSGIDLAITCKGDLQIDDHHTCEDCALAIGEAIDRALGERKGFARFGSAYAPLDESLARAVIDFSGRPFALIDLGLRREMLGDLACENIPHFLASFATAARAALHVDVLRGENDHHRAEAAFKSLALALRVSLACTGSGTVPSSKGVL